MSETLDHFDPGAKPPPEVECAQYFVYSGHSLLKHSEQDEWQPINEQEWQSMDIAIRGLHYMGARHQVACYAAEVEAGQPEIEGYDWVSLRHFVSVPDETYFALAGRGLQIVEWYRTHRYCGQCGDEMVDHLTDRARYCEDCDRSYFPRLSPCVIVLITRGEELLLAHGARHKDGMYSTLAGFIEPGETAEQAVHREVKEEVGISVQNLRYEGSQPWPFPHQLMLGFLAEYKSGDIRLDDDEISDAQWWHYRELPDHPPETTIAGRLIKTYLDSLSSAF